MLAAVGIAWAAGQVRTWTAWFCAHLLCFAFMMQTELSRSAAASALCVEACLACYRTCLGAALPPRHRSAEGASMGWELQQLLIVTAELCKLTAASLRGVNGFAPQLCRVCIALCSACAEACEEQEPLFADCVRECRRCAESCRAYAN